MTPKALIDGFRVSAFEIPTDSPEADGTIAWDKTTLVLVELSARGATGIGYTYADVSAAHFIDTHLKDVILKQNAMDIASASDRMAHVVRNLGGPGITSMAISAVDNALWDLKARLLELPLVALLGAARASVPVYGSGGFTSYSVPTLQKQLAGWVSMGIGAVKMKIGTHPEQDIARVKAAREAIGDKTQLFVDANGAYSRKQADAFAVAFQKCGVSWFEEPVTSDDLEGLRLLRDRAPAGMDIAAGEYGYTSVYFRRMLSAGAVDVLQADATRCRGITGFLRAAALCDAWNLPLSAHCAPSIHRHVCLSAPRVRHLEYFHDHVRIEQMLFEGAAAAAKGALVADLAKPGMGLTFKPQEAKRYAVYP